MSGHSKWATTKRKKARIDSARAKVFNRIIREITVAARLGGSDPEGNPRLRAAILKAKAANMPSKNMETAIAKGAGELEGVQYLELTYEGYGPNGVAVMVDAMTENKVRTVAEVRNIFSKAGGNMGETGSVSWMFHDKGVILLPKEAGPEDDVFMVVTDAGAEDFDPSGDEYEIITTPETFEAVVEALNQKGWAASSAEITKVPENRIKVTGEDVAKVVRLLDMLDDNDDVQNVHSNADFDAKDLENL